MEKRKEKRKNNKKNAIIITYMRKALPHTER